jgi:hypothetical protein
MMEHPVSAFHTGPSNPYPRKLLIVDPDSGRYPDVIRCGPGRDQVIYNKGLDKVAEDCEILKPYPKRWWTP